MTVKVRIFFLACIVLLSAGCSGGGGAVATVPIVSGVAASGAALSGTVYLKDSSSPARELSTVTAADGSFSFEVGSLKAPFLLKIESSGSTLYSFASGAGIANITPLSNLALIDACGSEDLATLYSDPAARMEGIEAALPNSVAALQAALQPVLAKYGATSLDFITDRFAADHHGLDLLLDKASISVANGTVTVTDRNDGSAYQIALSDFMTSRVDLDGGGCIFPGNPSVDPGGVLTFSARISGTPSDGIVWSVVESNGGTITSTGTYTAPSVTGTYHVKASSPDGTKSVMATVTVAVGVSNELKIDSLGQGLFALRTANLTGIAGMQVSISYDTSALVNPRVSKGASISTALLVVNDSAPGNVRLAAISARPFSPGIVATIAFDVIGSSTPIPAITGATMANASGSATIIPNY